MSSALRLFLPLLLPVAAIWALGGPPRRPYRIVLTCPGEKPVVRGRTSEKSQSFPPIGSRSRPLLGGASSGDEKVTLRLSSGRCIHLAYGGNNSWGSPGWWVSPTRLFITSRSWANSAHESAFILRLNGIRRGAGDARANCTAADEQTSFFVVCALALFSCSRSVSSPMRSRCRLRRLRRSTTLSGARSDRSATTPGFARFCGSPLRCLE